jgi:hypothetical protein
VIYAQVASRWSGAGLRVPNPRDDGGMMASNRAAHGAGGLARASMGLDVKTHLSIRLNGPASDGLRFLSRQVVEAGQALAWAAPRIATGWRSTG